MRFRGNEVILFHILDPQEIQPVMKASSVLVDLETDQEARGHSRVCAEQPIAKKSTHTSNDLRTLARAAGMDYQPGSSPTSRSGQPPSASIFPCAEAEN